MSERTTSRWQRATATAVTLAYCGSGAAAPLSLADSPLFVTTTAKPNVMMLYSNSNSMDEDPTGRAVGSASPASKSEIARGVIKNLVTTYGPSMNIGLMGFQQVTSGGNAVTLQQLHESPYDVSYNPANYNPLFNGARESLTKKFRMVNPTDTSNFIHYNVNLPFYSGGAHGNGFCYSATAQAFNNGEHPTLGPWDTYACYGVKTGTSDAAPGSAGAGYASFQFNSGFMPTDSDLGQGITDFGRLNTFHHVGPTWFSNGSPGKGYVHVPVATVDLAQTTKLNNKLATSQFAMNAPFDPVRPFQNAGLTPLEGTFQTARAYFNGTLTSSAEGGPLAAPTGSCAKNFLIALTNGLPSVTSAGVASSNVTAMLSAVTTEAANLYGSTAKVSTYVVGFALPYGVNPTQLDSIAAAGNTGTAYNAADQASLNQALTDVFSDIVSRSGSAGAVAMNSGQIFSGSKAYQARFNTSDWSGSLVSMTIGSDGSPGAINWDAGLVINSQSAASRKILSYKPSSGKGIAFRWPSVPASPTATEMDAAQVTALNTNPVGTNDGRGALRVDYLRGSASNEGSGPTHFRPRPTSKLGDIVNSGPYYVGAPTAKYVENNYASFRAAKASRTPVVYVGANDGMLHGFNASTGAEVLAYVPSGVYAKLSKLTGQPYTHTYFVDGSPVAGDAYLGADGWRTMLLGSMGAGARGLFALDVTDPSAFSEASAASIVRWEFTQASDGDVGFITGRPSIVKLNNGDWGAVFGNGYNGTSTGKGALYVVRLSDGNLLAKLSVSAGSVATPNGLNTAGVIDTDGNGTADYVYAGDLNGNMWKFDLSDSNKNQWKVAYAGAPLFSTATAGFGALPITAMPEIARHPLGGYMVVFGTGKYLEVSDLSSTTANYFFGIWDNGAALTASASLQAQTVTGTATGPDGAQYRLTSNTPVDYGSKKGWHLRLPTSGERNVTDPIVLDGRVVFTSMIPSSGTCSAGGESWLMELDFLSGSRLSVPPFDVNGDAKVDGGDKISGTIPSGKKLDGIGSSPTVLTGLGTPDSPLKRKQITLSTGAIQSVVESGNPATTRRTSWQQLR